MDFTVVGIVIQLIFLEGILSLDNAAVLGALVAHLPADHPVPWPKPLYFLARALNPLLGPQRTAGLRVGLLGAYLGRGLMLFLASIIVNNPWLRVLGAAYLIRLAFDNLGMAEENEADAHVHPADVISFWGIVVTVEMTDLIFSLDNVVAAVALSNRFWVVLVGVAIGILMMRFAAGLFTIAVLKEPVLKKTAYILVLIIGIELLLEEFAGVKINDWMRFGISASAILLSLAYAHSRGLQALRPVLVWLAQGFANVNELIDWLLVPLIALLHLLVKLFSLVFPRPRSVDSIPAGEDAHIHHP